MMLQDVLVKKRSGGRLVSFDRSKIEDAIYRAMCDTKQGNRKQAHELALQVNLDKRIIDIEEIQDQVERVLMNSLPDVARSYILYREKKKEHRKNLAATLNVPVDELDENSKKNLTRNSAAVFAGRYLLRDLKTNNIIERMPQLFDRVAKHIALVDVMYSDYIFDKNENFPQKEIDFERIKQLYSQYKDEDKNSRLNEFYLQHIFRRYNQLKSNILMSFEEFFFCLFTNLDSNVVKADARAYGFDIDTMIDTQENLINIFEENVSKYKNLMSSFRFLPNTPTIMNSGTKNGQLCACYTFDIDDNLRSIMNTVTDTAIIFQGAGGVGINFSKIRPFGDSVDNVPNAATGPISFQSIIDYITNIIKQGGKRKGANMGILEVWHPDIEKWINMKTVPGVMENYNISVGIDSNFWYAYDNNQDFNLMNPHTGQSEKAVPSHQLFSMIADAAWKCAEPGVIYLDNINKKNPLKTFLGPIKITNPCAEQAMYPNNSCTLGSINLAKYVHDTEFDYERFREDVYLATQLLDNVLDINNYPNPQIEEESLKIRRIGLGFMGLAHALYKMRIPYNSEKGFKFIENISNLLTFHSIEKSIELAEKRGAHSYWDKINQSPEFFIENRKNLKDIVEVAFDSYTESRLSKYLDRSKRLEYFEKIRQHGVRNTWTTTIAPTGTISMAADTSNGIEPIYALVSVKQTSIGIFYYVDKVFEQVLKEEGLHSDELLEKVAANHGSCKGLVPKHISDVFVTAVDIHWIDHLYALAMAQKGISNSISKTINLARYVTPEDIKLSYLLSRYLGIKGLSVYRDGCREFQVLDTTSLAKVKENEYKNPFNGHLTKIGEKGVEKEVVIETKPSETALFHIQDRILPQMNENVRRFATQILENNNIVGMTKRKVNTDLKCPHCSSGMIKEAHCTVCSECQYGYCS